MAVQQLATNEAQEEIPTHWETRQWINEHLGKSIKNHLLVRLGHEGMMLDKILKQNKIVRDGVRAHQRGETTVSAAATEEDQAVNIGNEIHYHGGTNQAPASQPTQQPAASTSNPWKTAALLGAAALAGGVPATLATLYASRPTTTINQGGPDNVGNLRLMAPDKPSQRSAP